MVALKLLESVLGKVATIGMAGYLFGWLCFIACVICTLAKAAQWRDVAGYCAFLLGWLFGACGHWSYSAQTIQKRRQSTA